VIQNRRTAMKKTALAIVVGLVAASVYAEDSPVAEGLGTIKREVREELQWLETLEPAKLEAFLEKHCPATLLVINKLGEKLSKAKGAEKEEIRQEITALVEERVYLHRELREYQKGKNARKAKACLQIFLFEDQKVLAELDQVRLERKKAKPAQIKAKEAEIEKLESKIDKLYDVLDSETEEK